MGLKTKLKGGSEFEAALKELAEKFKNPGTLRVGFLEGATYSEEDGGESVAAVAAYNEFGRMVHVKNEHGLKDELGGTYYQMPRPFFRNMIAANKGEWPKAIANLLSSTGYNTELTLKYTGEGIAKQLRESIQALVSPPLAQSTIDAKGFAKPLINTAHMYNSVDYEVETD